MMPTAASAAVEGMASVYLELGAVVLFLGLGAQAAGYFGLTPIPLYLVVGLVLGAFDIPALSGDFVAVASALGVVLLLFLIGLEYSAEELRWHLLRSRRAGVVDVLVNFPPGFALGLALGWDAVAAALLGGVTWVSSSSIIVKALRDLRRLACPETPVILSILVFEDLAMAGFLPLMGSLLVGGGVWATTGSIAIAAAAVIAALVGALRFGETLGRLAAHHSEEALLLSALGIVLLAAGVAEELQVSAAIGAFLVGIALSGEVAHRTGTLLAPIRDFNAALFFLFFALQVDTGELADVALPAALLALTTAATKAFTGWWAVDRAGLGHQARVRAALSLIPRGEMSIVLAGLGAGAGIEPRLAPLAAGYVLVLAITGPVLMRFSEAVAGRGQRPPAGEPTSALT
jgi:CPA2 family monovalent cation:H+ antiporter-2